MPLFDDVKSAFQALLSLNQVNHDNRKLIREVVLALQANLEESLTLTIYYLDGAGRIRDRDELLEHLYNAPMKLMGTFNQLKVCAGLYDLADRFGQVFDSLKGSIALGDIQAVGQLVASLERGERMVMDGLRDTTHQLADAARELQPLADGDYEVRRQQLLADLARERQTLRERIDWLARTCNEVLEKL